MNFQEYIPLAVRTAKPFPTTQSNLRHAVIGMLTEIGEYATCVKRVSIYGKERTPQIIANEHEELGDTSWYAALAAHTINTAMGEENNFHLDPSRFIPMTPYHRTMVMAGAAATAAQAVENANLGIVAQCVCEIMSVVMAAAHADGLELGDLLQANIDKLQGSAEKKGRYSAGYSDAEAEARADKEGADARSS